MAHSVAQQILPWLPCLKQFGVFPKGPECGPCRIIVKVLLSDRIATKGTLKGSFNDVQVELFERSAIHHGPPFNQLVTSLLEGSSTKEMFEAI